MVLYDRTSTHTFVNGAQKELFGKKDRRLQINIKVRP